MVAPSAEAKETRSAPTRSPKIAPATSVSTAAPGTDRLVTVT